MKVALSLIIFLTIIVASCKKENNSDKIVRNETGLLLKKIISGSDTLLFDYDKYNRLNKYTFYNFSFKYYAIIDSIVYNEENKMTAYRFTHKGNITTSNIHNFYYYPDSIIHLIRASTNNTGGQIVKYNLTNNKITSKQNGGNYLGVSNYSDTISYTYQDNKVIKNEYSTKGLQPPFFDLFTYNTNYNNPFRLLADHISTFIMDVDVLGGIAAGESSNFFSVESYASYTFIGDTYTFHPNIVYTSTVLESSVENNQLPGKVRKTGTDGLDIIATYFYTKQK